jgi:hypothetical protein
MNQRVSVHPLMPPPMFKSLCFLKNLTDGRNLPFKHSTFEPFTQNHDTTWELFHGITANHITLISYNFLVFMKLHKNLFVPVKRLKLDDMLLWRFRQICSTQNQHTHALYFPTSSFLTVPNWDCSAATVIHGNMNCSLTWSPFAPVLPPTISFEKK